MPLFIRYLVHDNTHVRHLVALPCARGAPQVRGGAGEIPPHLPWPASRFLCQ